jgi:hypothetical protein
MTIACLFACLVLGSSSSSFALHLLKRLYNFQIKLMQGERLASCSHFYLDLRPDEEKATNPTPGTPLLAEVSATPSASMSMSLSPSITASESVSPSPSPSLDERMLSSLRAEMTKLYAMVRDVSPVCFLDLMSVTNISIRFNEFMLPLTYFFVFVRRVCPRVIHRLKALRQLP